MKRAGFDVCSLLLVLGAIAALGCDRSPPGPKPAGPADSRGGIDTSLFVASGTATEIVRREATIKAPLRAVFERVTTEDGLMRAIGRTSHVDLRIGGPYELFLEEKNPVGDQGSEGSQILSYVPNRMISFSWSAPRRFPEERKKRTWVVITFDPVGDNATYVTLTHLGFGQGGQWAELRNYFETAWGGFLKLIGESFGGADVPAKAESKPTSR